MSRITINVLGPFEALGPRGEKLAVHSRRSRALLSCLAIETGESWTRSRLATLLWNERSEQQGRSSLRQELVQLRRDLGVTAPVDWGRGPFVGLPKQMLTDVARFRAAVATGDALQAAAIWRGELLQAMDLKAGPFTEWLALSRSRLRGAAVACFAKALREAGSDNDPLPLEGVASKLIALDPGNEEAHRLLMRSSASRHDLAELVERYRRYVMTAGRGAGGDPSVAMKRFLDQMIAESSRPGKLSSTGFSTRWIEEINRQHHSAAAPEPTHLARSRTQRRSPSSPLST